jgi:hypothetical protein
VHADVAGDPLEPRIARIERQALERRRHARRGEDVVGQDDFAGVRESLHAGRDVDGLAEVVDALIQRPGEAGPCVQADLEADQVGAGVAVESRDPLAHRERDTQRVHRLHETRHDGVANGLDQRVVVARDALAERWAKSAARSGRRSRS